jgi:hypothetical protein
MKLGENWLSISDFEPNYGVIYNDIRKTMRKRLISHSLSAWKVSKTQSLFACSSVLPLCKFVFETCRPPQMHVLLKLVTNTAEWYWNQADVNEHVTRKLCNFCGNVNDCTVNHLFTCVNEVSSRNRVFREIEDLVESELDAAQWMEQFSTTMQNGGNNDILFELFENLVFNHSNDHTQHDVIRVLYGGFSTEEGNNIVKILKIGNILIKKEFLMQLRSILFQYACDLIQSRF